MQHPYIQRKGCQRSASLFGAPSFRGLSRSRPIFSIKPDAVITQSKLISGIGTLPLT